MRTSKNFTLSERFFFRTERPLTNSPPLILASSSPQVCFWVVLIPKNWGGGFGNLKSCWYSVACVLSWQESEALDRLPPTHSSKFSPQVCFWVVPIPKSWKKKKKMRTSKCFTLSERFFFRIGGP